MNTWGEIKFKLEMDVCVHVWVNACACVPALCVPVCICVCVPVWPQAPNQAWRLKALPVSGHHTWSEWHEPCLYRRKRSGPLVLPRRRCTHGQIKTPYFKLGTKNNWASIPLVDHTHTRAATHTHIHTQWAGLIRFNYTPRLSVITCDAALTLLLWILAFSFTSFKGVREGDT